MNFGNSETVQDLQSFQDFSLHFVKMMLRVDASFGLRVFDACQVVVFKGESSLLKNPLETVRNKSLNNELSPGTNASSEA